MDSLEMQIASMLTGTFRLHWALIAVAPIAVALTACGYTKMTLTGSRGIPRPMDCDFEVFTASRASGFRELGTIDVETDWRARNDLRQLAYFKTQIQPYVCDAGGDAVFAHANGEGLYMKATIVKRVEPPRDEPQAERADLAGCRYDTQCKGDRICVQGTCTAPPAPTSVSHENADTLRRP